MSGDPQSEGTRGILLSSLYASLLPRLLLFPRSSGRFSRARVPSRRAPVWGASEREREEGREQRNDKKRNSLSAEYFTREITWIHMESRAS